MTDARHIKTQKQLARELRQSHWWQKRLDADPHCYYCQKSLLRHEVTMDHVVPIARGGCTTKSNVVVSCKECNNQKKWLTAAEWQAQRQPDNDGD